MSLPARARRATKGLPTAVARSARLQHVFVQPGGVLTQEQVHVLASEAGQGNRDLRGTQAATKPTVGGSPGGGGDPSASAALR